MPNLNLSVKKSCAFNPQPKTTLHFSKTASKHPVHNLAFSSILLYFNCSFIAFLSIRS